MGKLKTKGNSLITFIDSLKLKDGEINSVNLSMSFMPAPRFLKLSLSTHPKFTSKLNKYLPELIAHSTAFKQYLWENNCIDVSERELIELTFLKEKDSVVEIKKRIENMLRTNKNEAGLEDCLLKTLELRELMMFQIEERDMKFVKYNPLLEI